MTKGGDYCGLAKISQKAFCISTLENLTKYFLLGSYHVMKISPRGPGGISLMAIGYKYNYRKVLTCFRIK